MPETSVEQIERFDAKCLRLSRKMAKNCGIAAYNDVRSLGTMHSNQ